MAADGQPAAPLSQQMESVEDTDFYSEANQTPSVTTGQHISGEDSLVLIDTTAKSSESSGSDLVPGVKSFTTEDVKSAESQVTWESEMTDRVSIDMQPLDEESKKSLEESKKSLEESKTSLDKEDQKTPITDDQQASVSKETSAMTVTLSESETQVSLDENLHETSTETSAKPRYPKSETYSVSKHNTLSDSLNQANQENMSDDAEHQSPGDNMLGKPEIMSQVHQPSDMQTNAAENVTPTADSPPGEPSKADEKDSSMHASQTQRDTSMHASQTQKLGTVACEGPISTGYLDSVISDMQSMSGNQCEAAGGSVQISRAELALMVAQTLKAQTMSTYMQDLVHTNCVLNTQNEVMKETIVQMRNCQNAGDKGEKGHTSLPPQPTEAEVFRFDKYSLPPASLPVVLDRSSSTSGFCSFSKLDQAGASQNTDQEMPVSIVLMDGEPITVVPQLADCVSFDGDPSLRSKENRGASAAGSSGNTGASASNFAPSPGLNAYNMPNQALFDMAGCYSLGPQQQEEILGGSAGVPPEQHQLATDELEKMKMFLHKITTEGGVHPNNLMELANLRNQVNNLRTENGQLKAELENRPVPHSHTALNRQIQDLNDKILQQKKIEDKLCQAIFKLQENKKLRDPRPSSQPPSSVGLHALPTIPALQNPVASRESELQTDKLQKENDKLRQICAEARRYEIAAKEATQQAQSKLNATTDYAANLKHELEGKTTHCEKLGNELRGLNTEIDRLKKMHLQEADRCKQLEQMIADERKRWSRDEKQLLDQVRKDAKFIQVLEELVLAVDRVRDGITLQPSQEDHLAALKEQSVSRGSLTTSTRSTKSASSRAGATATSASSSRTQHQNPRSSSGNTSTGTGPRPLQGFHGSSREGGGSAGGRGTHSSTIHGSGGGSPASLPSVLPQQRTRQHSGTPAVQPHGNRPLQRSNIAGSSPEMLPPPGSGAGSGRQRQQ